jgi:dipeptidyl aminopeptidase/acylaminoacyl peptidase
VVTRAKRRLAATLATTVALACAEIPVAAATYRTEPRTLVVGLWRPDSLPYPDEGDSDLWLLAPDGTPVRRLTHTPHRDEQHPRWAPTGRRIVFAAGRYESCEVYSIRPDGTGKQRMTRDAAVDGEPTWSPDGRWIAWIHTRARTSIDELWMMRADGSDRHRVPVRVPSFTFESPMWSPDGSTLAMSIFLDRNHQFDIFHFRPNGSGLERLTRTARSEVLMDWSPSGRRLLVSRARTPFIYDDPDALITLHADGSDARRVIPDAFFLDGRYTPDGRSAYLTEPRGGGWTRLARARLPSGSPRTLLSIEGHVITSDFSCG